MALPWLIGGAIAAIATAVAAAVSDDDPPRKSGSNGHDEERRRREKAEEERKKRVREEKRQAAREAFQQEGQRLGASLADVLPTDLVSATSHDGFKLDIGVAHGQMEFELTDAVVRDFELLAVVESLDSMLSKRSHHQDILRKIATFSELYKPDFERGSELKLLEGQVRAINTDVERLKDIRADLTKLQGRLATENE